jgi:hypothetical protein
MNLDDLIRRLECGPIDLCTAQEAAKALRKVIADKNEWREACLGHGEKAERAERELAAAVAKEREECAKILDRREEMETQTSERHANNGKHFKAREAAHVARIAKSDAAAIRALGKTNG